MKAYGLLAAIGSLVFVGSEGAGAFEVQLPVYSFVKGEATSTKVRALVHVENKNDQQLEQVYFRCRIEIRNGSAFYQDEIDSWVDHVGPKTFTPFWIEMSVPKPEQPSSVECTTKQFKVLWIKE